MAIKKEKEKETDIGHLREPKGFMPGKPELFGEGFVGHMDRMKKKNYGKPLPDYEQVATGIEKHTERWF